MHFFRNYLIVFSESDILVGHLGEMHGKMAIGPPVFLLVFFWLCCTYINNNNVPLTFCLLGAEINRIKKSHQEASSRRGPQPSHLRGLHDELQGVQRIMFENVDAVLRRGELVSGNTVLVIIN